MKSQKRLWIRKVNHTFHRGAKSRTQQKQLSTDALTGCVSKNKKIKLQIITSNLNALTQQMFTPHSSYTSLGKAPGQSGFRN